MHSHDTTLLHNLSMLESLKSNGMTKPPSGRIGLRSGTILSVCGVRIEKRSGEDRDDVEVVAYQNTDASSRYDEVRFLVSSVEFVTRLGLDGVSPERASNSHAGKTLTMVDRIMTPEHEELMDRFRVLAARCTDERPEWFTNIVQMQIARYDQTKMRTNELDIDTLKALLSDVADDREVTAAVMLLLIDFCYNALEDAYAPYVSDDAWTAAAMTRIDERLTELEV